MSRSLLTLPAARHYRRCVTEGSNYLDPDRPEAVRLSVGDALDEIAPPTESREHRRGTAA
jgi:hypothetical protein